MDAAACRRAAAWHRVVTIGATGTAGAISALGRTAAAVASAGGIAFVVPGAEPGAIAAAGPSLRAAVDGCGVALVRTGTFVAPVIPRAVLIIAMEPIRIVTAAASTVAIVLIPTSASRGTAHAGSLAAGLAAIAARRAALEASTSAEITTVPVTRQAVVFVPTIVRARTARTAVIVVHGHGPAPFDITAPTPMA
jgi:hypothetical protein